MKTKGRGRPAMPPVYREVWQRLRQWRNRAKKTAKTARLESVRLKAQGRADALEAVLAMLPLLRPKRDQ